MRMLLPYPASLPAHPLRRHVATGPAPSGPGDAAKVALGRQVWVTRQVNARLGWAEGHVPVRRAEADALKAYEAVTPREARPTPAWAWVRFMAAYARATQGPLRAPLTLAAMAGPLWAWRQATEGRVPEHAAQEVPLPRTLPAFRPPVGAPQADVLAYAATGVKTPAFRAAEAREAGPTSDRGQGSHAPARTALERLNAKLKAGLQVQDAHQTSFRSAPRPSPPSGASLLAPRAPSSPPVGPEVPHGPEGGEGREGRGAASSPFGDAHASPSRGAALPVVGTRPRLEASGPAPLPFAPVRDFGAHAAGEAEDDAPFAEGAEGQGALDPLTLRVPVRRGTIVVQGVERPLYRTRRQAWASQPAPVGGLIQASCGDVGEGAAWAPLREAMAARPEAGWRIPRALRGLDRPSEGPAPGRASKGAGGPRTLVHPQLGRVRPGVGRALPLPPLGEGALRVELGSWDAALRALEASPAVTPVTPDALWAAYGPSPVYRAAVARGDLTALALRCVLGSPRDAQRRFATAEAAVTAWTALTRKVTAWAQAVDARARGMEAGALALGASLRARRARPARRTQGAWAEAGPVWADLDPRLGLEGPWGLGAAVAVKGRRIPLEAAPRVPSLPSPVTEALRLAFREVHRRACRRADAALASQGAVQAVGADGAASLALEATEDAVFAHAHRAWKAAPRPSAPWSPRGPRGPWGAPKAGAGPTRRIEVRTGGAWAGKSRAVAYVGTASRARRPRDAFARRQRRRALMFAAWALGPLRAVGRGGLRVRAFPWPSLGPLALRALGRGAPKVRGPHGPHGRLEAEARQGQALGRAWVRVLRGTRARLPRALRLLGALIRRRAQDARRSAPALPPLRGPGSSRAGRGRRAGGARRPRRRAVPAVWTGRNARWLRRLGRALAPLAPRGVFVLGDVRAPQGASRRSRARSLRAKGASRLSGAQGPKGERAKGRPFPGARPGRRARATVTGHPLPRGPKALTGVGGKAVGRGWTRLRRWDRALARPFVPLALRRLRDRRGPKGEGAHPDAQAEDDAAAAARGLKPAAYWMARYPHVVRHLIAAKVRQGRQGRPWGYGPGSALAQARAAWEGDHGAIPYRGRPTFPKPRTKAEYRQRPRTLEALAAARPYKIDREARFTRGVRARLAPHRRALALRGDHAFRVAAARAQGTRGAWRFTQIPSGFSPAGAAPRRPAVPGVGARWRGWVRRAFQAAILGYRVTWIRIPGPVGPSHGGGRPRWAVIATDRAGRPLLKGVDPARPAWALAQLDALEAALASEALARSKVREGRRSPHAGAGGRWVARREAYHVRLAVKKVPAFPTRAEASKRGKTARLYRALVKKHRRHVRAFEAAYPTRTFRRLVQARWATNPPVVPGVAPLARRWGSVRQPVYPSLPLAALAGDARYRGARARKGLNAYKARYVRPGQFEPQDPRTVARRLKRALAGGRAGPASGRGLSPMGAMLTSLQRVRAYGAQVRRAHARRARLRRRLGAWRRQAKVVSAPHVRRLVRRRTPSPLGRPKGQGRPQLGAGSASDAPARLTGPQGVPGLGSPFGPERPERPEGPEGRGGSQGREAPARVQALPRRALAAYGHRAGVTAAEAILRAPGARSASPWAASKALAGVWAALTPAHRLALTPKASPALRGVGPGVRGTASSGPRGPQGGGPRGEGEAEGPHAREVQGPSPRARARWQRQAWARPSLRRGGRPAAGPFGSGAASPARGAVAVKTVVRALEGFAHVGPLFEGLDRAPRVGAAALTGPDVHGVRGAALKASRVPATLEALRAWRAASKAASLSPFGPTGALEARPVPREGASSKRGWRPSMVPRVRWERRGGHLRKHTATWIHKGGVARPRATRADLPTPLSAHAVRRARVRARTRAMKAKGRQASRASGPSALPPVGAGRAPTRGRPEGSKAQGGRSDRPSGAVAWAASLAAARAALQAARPKTARGRWKRARKILEIKRRGAPKVRAVGPARARPLRVSKAVRAHAAAEAAAGVDPGFGRPFVPMAAQGRGGPKGKERRPQGPAASSGPSPFGPQGVGRSGALSPSGALGQEGPGGPGGRSGDRPYIPKDRRAPEKAKAEGASPAPAVRPAAFGRPYVPKVPKGTPAVPASGRPQGSALAKLNAALNAGRGRPSPGGAGGPGRGGRGGSPWGASPSGPFGLQRAQGPQRRGARGPLGPSGPSGGVRGFRSGRAWASPARPQGASQAGKGRPSP